MDSWLKIVDNPVPISKELFDEFWNNKPTTQHTVKYMGKEFKVPRTQVTYLRPYKFSGNVLEPEPGLPEIIKRSLSSSEYDWEWSPREFL